RLLIKAAELLDGGVGIRGSLEVRQETLGAVALLQDRDPPPDLLADGCAGQPAVRAEAAVVAIHAAADRRRAIDVRTGEAGVDGEAIALAAEPLAQDPAEGIVPPLGRKRYR